MGATAKTLDMSNVRDASAFSPRRMPEGDYLAKIVDVADHKSKDGGAGWVFTIQLDENKRATYAYYCMFAENQLWKIRTLATSAGIKVPKSRLKIDPNKLLNKAIGIYLVDDEYEGRVKSSIDSVFPSSDVDTSRDDADVDDDDIEDDEEEEVAPPKKATKRKPAPVVEDDDEDDDEEEEEEPAPVKPTRKKAAGKKAPIVEEDDDEEEDDEDDEPAPAPKRRAKAAPAKKAATKRKAPVEDDEDEDDDLDLDEL